MAGPCNQQRRPQLWHEWVDSARPDRHEQAMTVIVLGNALIDTTFRVQRLPRTGETVLAAAKAVDLGGKGLNQAVAAAMAGAPTRLFTALGEDDAGRLVSQRLEAIKGLEVRAWQRTFPTDESVIVVAGDGQNTIVSTHQCARSITDDDVDEALSGAAPDDVWVMQGNLDLSVTVRALQEARGKGLRTVWNPAPVPNGLAEAKNAADIMVVNEVEAAALLGGDPAAMDPRRIPADALSGVLVVTLGAEGALIVAEGKRTHMRAPAVTAVDTTGAGDAFVGTMAAMLASGASLVAATQRAVTAASDVVTRQGAFGAITTMAIS
ncbi:MAG: PfkB family carbohydrate kinase [Pseudomonadota bacterium]